MRHRTYSKNALEINDKRQGWTLVVGALTCLWRSKRRWAIPEARRMASTYRVGFAMTAPSRITIKTVSRIARRSMASRACSHGRMTALGVRLLTSIPGQIC